MSSDPSNNKNLPPWLRDMPLPPRPRDLAAPRAALGDDAAQLSSWLGETSAPASHPAPAGEPPEHPAGMGDQGGLPDWLRSSQAEQPGGTSGANQLPSWLHDIAGAPGAPDRPVADLPAANSSGEAAIPDWLRESQANTPSGSSEQLPDWLLDIAGIPADQGNPETSTPPEPREASPNAGETVPSWLHDQETAAPHGEPAQPAPPPTSSASDAAIPNWLDDIGGSADEGISEIEPFSFDDTSGASASAGTPSLPSWLSSDDTKDSAVTMPDWLQESGSAATPQPEAPADQPSWLMGAAGQASENDNAIPGQADVPLWLQDAGQQPAAADSAAEPPAAHDVPAWLSDASATPPSAQEPPTPQPGAGDVPPWLQGTPPTQPDTGNMPSWLQDTPSSQPSVQEPVAPQPDTSNLPSWLQEMPAERVEPPPADDVPAWLKDTSDEQPASETATGGLPSWLQETPAAPSAPAEDMPPWLSDIPGEPPAGEPTPSEQPAWLQEAPAAQPAETEIKGDLPAHAVAPEAPEPDELPEWLRPAATEAPPSSAGQDIPPWLRDEAGQPLPTAGSPGDTNLPTWLRGATIEPGQSTPASSPPSSPAPQPASPGFDWFADAEEPAQPAPVASAASNELVGGIELPAWLRPPEPEQPKELNPTDARSLDWLTRLGGHEEEEALSATIAPAAKLRPPSTPARTAAQVEAIALLQHLAAHPYPEVAPSVEVVEPSIWRRFGLERLLYLALLFVLVIALALPISGSLGLNAPPTAPGAQDMFAQIDQLTPNDTVLVGYEWDARRSGELRPLEQAVLGHLIQRNVKLVLVSTDAQGSLLLFDLRDELGAAGYKPSGEDYILLGYKPGAELALRSLAQDFRGALRSDFQGNDATLSGLATNAGGQPRLTSLADFAMVLVLADEPADVQGWMEQVRTSARKSDGSFVPFDFVLPAETAPIVQPYLSQSGVYHLSGKLGALAYQQLHGQNPSTAQVAVEAGQQRLSLLIYIILFVVGAAGVGISGAVARGRSRP